MPKYYILIKRKGAKKWMGAIPSKKGIGKTKLQSSIKNQIKKGFSYRIINSTQLKKMLSGLISKTRTTIKKKITKKRKKPVKRKKVTRRRRKKR